MTNQRLKELEEIGFFNLTEEQMEEYEELINNIPESKIQETNRDWDIIPNTLEIFNSLPLSRKCGITPRKLRNPSKR